MRRREFLTYSAATAAALPFATALSQLLADDKAPKKILYFSRSQGFEHDPVKLGADGESVSDKALKRLGKELGVEVVCTKDGTVFDGDLSQYGAIIFYTSGDLDKDGGNDGGKAMTAQGVKNFYAAIRGGAGFLGFHSSTDTWRGNTGYKVDAFFDQPEYIRLQGGEFIIHGEQQEATVEVVDDVLPWSKGKKSFRHHDEWYANKNFAPEMRVLMSLQTAGMKNKDHNKCYDRPAFPCVWARKEGAGTVLYCAFGHKNSFWEGDFDALIGDLVRAALGEIKISTEPNLKTSCPGADMLQNEWNGRSNGELY